MMVSVALTALAAFWLEEHHHPVWAIACWVEFILAVVLDVLPKE